MDIAPRHLRRLYSVPGDYSASATATSTPNKASAELYSSSNTSGLVPNLAHSSKLGSTGLSSMQGCRIPSSNRLAPTFPISNPAGSAQLARSSAALTPPFTFPRRFYRVLSASMTASLWMTSSATTFRPVLSRRSTYVAFTSRSNAYPKFAIRPETASFPAYGPVTDPTPTAHSYGPNKQGLMKRPGESGAAFSDSPTFIPHYKQQPNVAPTSVSNNR